MAQITSEAFIERLQAGKLRLLEDLPDDFRLNGSKVVLSCYCGQEFTAAARQVWFQIRTSCGCKRRVAASKINPSKRTYGEIQTKLQEVQVQLLTPVDLNAYLQDPNTVGAHIFKCRCGKEFGEATTLKHILSGNTRSCGCLKQVSILANAKARRGRPHSLKQKESWKARYSITSDDVVKQATFLGVTILESLPDKLQTRAPLKLLCSCKREFSTRAADFVRGYSTSCGCVISRPEAEIGTFVESLTADVQIRKYSLLGDRQIDVLVSGKLAIEHHGLHWHGESHLQKQKDRDLFKGDPCRDTYHKWQRLQTLNIRSLFVFEDEWKYRRAAVEGYILSILGQKPRIGARKCQAAFEPEAARKFTESWHIQGGAPGPGWVLLYQGEVVAAATFREVRGQRAVGSNCHELVRYCVGPQAVVGGLSKLIAAYRASTTCDVLITYSDNRLSDGAIYKATGFTKTGDIKPRYWYHTRYPLRRYHRFGFRLDVLKAKGLWLPGETEWQTMQRIGYDRIWDAGHRKWTLKFV